MRNDVDAQEPLAPELAPQQLAPISPEPKVAGSASLDGRLMSACGGAVVLLAAVVMFGFFGGSAPATAPAPRGDRLTADEAAKLTAGFNGTRALLVPADISNPRERATVIAVLHHLPAARRDALLAMVDNGQRALAWLSLWDNYDEDGDVVSVSAAGVTQTVPLWRVPTRLVVPYIPGQPVFVTGERDGGGGITVAVELSTGPLPLPPLAVGQTVALPIQ